MFLSPYNEVTRADHELAAPQRRGRGRPRWIPSSQQRSAVQEAARRGLPQDLIAELVGISESTLKRRCAKELHLGAMAATVSVALAAFELAVSGDNPAMTRWWLRVRAGWRLPGCRRCIAPGE